MSWALTLTTEYVAVRLPSYELLWRREGTAMQRPNFYTYLAFVRRPGVGRLTNATRHGNTTARPPPRAYSAYAVPDESIATRAPAISPFPPGGSTRARMEEKLQRTEEKLDRVSQLLRELAARAAQDRVAQAAQGKRTEELVEKLTAFADQMKLKFLTRWTAL